MSIQRVGAAGASPEPLRINFSWLIRLRWGAIVGQVGLTFFVDRIMGMPLPLAPLGAMLLGAVLVNGFSLVWVRRAPRILEVHLALAMALDLLLFTGLLYVTGGPSNPFSSLYLIHIALAAVVLPPRWTWALVALTLACSAGLFLDHLPLDHAHAHHHEPLIFDWHLRGMWVALGVAASFIVYFLHRVTRALRERDRELSRERERTMRNERAAAVATLAAGAAHELSSPLGTIAVASGELELELRKTAASEHAIADAVLIRQEVSRCRRILDQLAADSGQAAGGPVIALRASELAEHALLDLAGRERVVVQSPGGPEERIFAPQRALVQAIRSLLENALHATQAHQDVVLAIQRRADVVRIEVTDTGVGMPQDVLERAAEPFFSTRGSGRGMGLGLFLAQSVADQLGGKLELTSEPGQGTSAVLVLPASVSSLPVPVTS